MILAGLTLAAVGVADLARLARGRTARGVLLAVAAIALFLAAASIDAGGWALLALVLAALWVLVVPADGSGRAGLWPTASLAAVVVVGVAAAGARPGIRVLGAEPVLPGGASLDVVALVVGAALFLVESANIVVRTALRGEVARTAVTGLKGGRLIGPLERLLVFGLTLVGAYTLLAAVLAAKGIVRFPEISRDAGEGNRAEYFLVGTLVSWTLAVAGTFLVWWSLAPR